MHAPVVWSAAVTLLLIVVCAAQAEYSAVKGGCYGEHSWWTLKISSAEDNAAAAAYVAERGYPFLCLAGSVYSGAVYWDDGGVVAWTPAGFHPPVTADGILTLQADGSWWYAAEADYFQMTFLCTDGQSSTTTEVPSNTTTTTTTTEVPSNTTTTTTEYPHSSSEAPLPVLTWLLSELSSTFNSVGAISVAAFTSNVISIASNPATVVNLQRRLNAGSIVLVGFGNCRLGQPQHVARLSVLDAEHVGFHVPFAVGSASSEMSFAVCLLGYERMQPSSTPFPQTTTATLLVVQLSQILSSLGGFITVSEEDVLLGDDHTKSLPLTGPGTLVPFTTDLSPQAYSDVSLFLVNNGVLGQSCSASNLPISFAIVRGALQLHLPASHISRINSGPKSLCASLAASAGKEKGHFVVAAKFVSTAISATAPQTKYTYGMPVPVTLIGITPNSLAKGYVTAFLSGSSDCSSKTGKATVEVSNTFSPIPPHLFAVAPVTSTQSSRYLCLMYRNSKAIKVSGVSTAGTTVSVAAATSKANPARLSFFQGFVGAIWLETYVTPPASDSDWHHFKQTLELVASESEFVRFVPLTISAATTHAQKLAACQGQSQDARMELRRGTLPISREMKLSHSSGILCIDRSYIRVDYAVMNPCSWLLSLGGVASFPHPFVLSVDGTADASPLSFAGQNYGDLAIRLSAGTTCSAGFVFPVRTAGEGSIVGLPSASAGEFTLCVGLFQSGKTSVFASTGRIVKLATYNAALRSWKYALTTQNWLPCGAAAACGAATSQNYVLVCPPASAVAVAPWPERLADEVNYLGSLEVLIGSNGVSAKSCAFMGNVFVSSADGAASCLQYSLLEMTSDGSSFSTSVVSTFAQPIIEFKTPEPVSGVTFGLVPWDQKCDTRFIVMQAIAMRSPFHSAVSLDVSPLAYAGLLNYYQVCYQVSSRWYSVDLSFIKVSDASSVEVRVEAIGTGNPVDNEARIHLWQTQIVTWVVMGQFTPLTASTFSLVWDDATCTTSLAYATAVEHVSSTAGAVTVDTNQILEAPHRDSLLYACFSTVLDATSRPLTFEQHRSRSISLSRFTLSSLNYLPQYAIAHTTTTDTRLLLTDTSKPPITQVALFLAISPTGMDAAEDCGTASQNLVTILQTSTDSLGLRWITVPSWVPRSVGSAEQTVSLFMCATASTAPSPRFQPVQAYITVDTRGMNEDGNAVYFHFVFTPVSSQTDVVDATAGTEALRGYMRDVVGFADADRVLVAEMSANQFTLFVKLSPDVRDEIDPTRKVYTTLQQGKGLPLFVDGSTNSSSRFVLHTVEGYLLGTQKVSKDYPIIQLRTTPAGMSDSVAVTSIALFCIVAIPTAIGVVIFSIGRSIPKLAHRHNSKKSPVFIETGDSPLPRNPRSRRDGNEMTVVNFNHQCSGDVAEPDAEDTVANPLNTNSEGDNECNDLDCSPMAHNRTFAREPTESPSEEM